jgi:hypothetical protein
MDPTLLFSLTYASLIHRFILSCLSLFLFYLNIYLLRQQDWLKMALLLADQSTLP